MTRVFVVGICGPLEAYGKGFGRALLALGYTRLSAANQLRLFAHLSRWLDEHELKAKALTAEVATRFLQARRRAGYTSFLSLHGLERIFEYLRARGIIPAPVRKSAPPKGTAERLIAEYARYLSHERGLAQSTILQCSATARGFLVEMGATRSKLDAVRPKDVRRFLLGMSRVYSPASVAGQGSNLRSFFRFLFVTGFVRRDLSGAVPSAPGWCDRAIPRGISAEEVQCLLCSCNRKTTIGRRDYAVLVLMTRLGLRAGEVLSLKIDDVDWRQGEITIHGKGSKLEQLPLPKDVGEALSAYLRVRPRVKERQVFLRARAPNDALTAVGFIAFAASQRAGLGPVWPRQLRRTVATEMLKRGASLQEIAEVLRHTETQTTAIYAKVDRLALRALVQPWPGARQ